MTNKKSQKLTKSNKKKKLSEKQKAAIELMVQCKKANFIAARVGVRRETLYKWNQDPLFEKELAKRREELWHGSKKIWLSMYVISLQDLHQRVENSDLEVQLFVVKSILDLMKKASNTASPEELLCSSNSSKDGDKTPIEQCSNALRLLCDSLNLMNDEERKGIKDVLKSLLEE